MRELNRGVINDWRMALLSGKYNQGGCRLKNRNGNYCCLGVLAEVIYGPDSLFGDQESGFSLVLDGFVDASKLPEQVGVFLNNYLGISQEGFIRMNDVCCMTFEEIAKCLE